MFRIFASMLQSFEFQVSIRASELRVWKRLESSVVLVEGLGFNILSLKLGI